MNAIEREIRDCLLGRTLPMQKGRLRAMGPDDYRQPIGVGDGAGAVRFLGVASDSRVLQSDLSETELLKSCRQSMHSVGRSLLLLQQPDNPACLIRYVLTSPVIVLVHIENELPLVTAYSGRSIRGWISIIRALATFESHLPENIAISAEKAPKETRKARKKRKKEERKAAKAARKEARAEYREMKKNARMPKNEQEEEDQEP